MSKAFEMMPLTTKPRTRSWAWIGVALVCALFTILAVMFRDIPFVFSGIITGCAVVLPNALHLLPRGWARR